MKKFNLNAIPGHLLNEKVVDVFVNNAYVKDKKVDIKKTFTNYQNKWLKFIISGYVIIGKFYLSKLDNNYLFYDGYFIGENSLKKVSHQQLFIGDDMPKFVVLTETEVSSIVTQLENIILKLNNFVNKTKGFFEKEKFNKFPNWYTRMKPNIDDIMTINVDDKFIKQYGQLTLQEVRDEKINKYNKELEQYNTIYNDNKQLIGKMFLASNFIGIVTKICEYRTDLYANAFCIETNKFEVYNHMHLSQNWKRLEIPKRIYQQSVNIWHEIQTIHNNLLN